MVLTAAEFVIYEFLQMFYQTMKISKKRMLESFQIQINSSFYKYVAYKSSSPIRCLCEEIILSRCAKNLYVGASVHDICKISDVIAS